MKQYFVVVAGLVITAFFVIFSFIAPETFGIATDYVLNVFIADNFGWYYMLIALVFVFVCLYVAVSKYGNIRLGKDDDRPEFNTFTWIAMLYSAGIAASLFYFGVAEPVLMYMEPPFGEGQTKEAADVAMQHTFLHWGLHSFSLYSITGLIMAYFQYRKGTPPLLSYTLRPLIGDKIFGPIGKTVNIVTIFALISGITTSLGLASKQIGAGFDYVLGVNNSLSFQILIIISLSLLFIISASTGVDRGIKWLSNINVVLALFIMALIFLLGPTRHILEVIVNTTGGYIQNFASMSFHLEPFINDYDWQSGWDFFYWGWALSFGVFVGLFTARISKGRTIREFIFGAVLIPALATTIWYSTFGGSALYNIVNLGNNELANKILENMDTALFYFLQLFSLSPLLIILTFISIVIFFVTSGDSAIYVLSMYSEERTVPTLRSKIMWGFVIVGFSISLLLSGGLVPLQSISAAAGLPFSIVLILSCISLFKSLKEENIESLSSEKDKRNVG